MDVGPRPMLTLYVRDEPLAICRLDPAEDWPAWALSASFVSLTRTASELSVVCPESLVPDGVRAERGWVAFEVAGPLDLTLTGILAELAGLLAAEQIALFAVSTFDTDYLLVRRDACTQAIAALKSAGHEVYG